MCACADVRMCKCQQPANKKVPDVIPEPFNIICFYHAIEFAYLHIKLAA